MTALAVAAPAAHAREPPVDRIGAQLRLAPSGPGGADLRVAREVDIAYNRRRDEFFVVWSDRGVESATREIYGRRLDGRGEPIGSVQLLTRHDSWSTGPAGNPAIAYDPDHDRYLVAYEHERAQTAVEHRLVAWDGTPADPVRPADAVTGAARTQAATSRRNPDVVYDHARKRFVVVWDEGAEVLADDAGTQGLRIFGWEVDARSGNPVGSAPTALSESCAGDCFEPVVALAGPGSYLLAWIDAAGIDEPGGVWGRVVQSLATPIAPSSAVTQLAGGASRHPAVAAHEGRALLAHTELTPNRRPEVHATLLALGSAVPAVVAPERRVDAGAVPGVGGEMPATASHPRRGVFLVAWNGTDDGTSRAFEGEREVTGQVIDRDGRDSGLDDFLISQMGFAGSGEAGTSRHPPALAPNSASGEWAVAWAGEDDRPPLNPGELELWGRRVGPNADRDFDGVPAPADCDDLAPAVHPGAEEHPANGIDEDCSDGDDRDGDGDGALPPRDCDDDDPLVRPGRREVAGNGVDDDCDGRDAFARTRARIQAAWLFGAQSTTVVRLTVENVRRGMTVTLRCRGAGCPAGLRGAGAVRRPRRAGALRLTRLLTRSRLRDGAVVGLRVLDPRAIGLLRRFTIRGGRPPRESTRCLTPAKRRLRCDA